MRHQLSEFNEQLDIERLIDQNIELRVMVDNIESLLKKYTREIECWLVMQELADGYIK